jgi:hypothetical protein
MAVPAKYPYGEPGIVDGGRLELIVNWVGATKVRAVGRFFLVGGRDY